MKALGFEYEGEYKGLLTPWRWLDRWLCNRFGHPRRRFLTHTSIMQVTTDFLADGRQPESIAVGTKKGALCARCVREVPL